MKHRFLCVLTVIILLLLSGCQAKNSTAYPPLLYLDGAQYKLTGGYVENSVDRPELVGTVQSEVPATGRPCRELETNCPGFLGNEIYRIDENTVIVAYTGPDYGDWRRFELQE